MIIKTKPDEFQSLLVDASNYPGNAEAAYFPENIPDVQNILRMANQRKIQVTISGNGTGLTGGRCPEGGIILSTAKLNHIGELNRTTNTITAGAGVVLADLKEHLSQLGYFYPPDPTEQNCFLGATIATNASGAKTFGYGPTRKYIKALEIVLPDGSVTSLRRGEYRAKGLHLTLPNGETYLNIDLPDYEMPSVKNAAGYFIQSDMDAIDLFIGSEGTLGIVTQAELEILPLPAKVISGILFFESESNALGFIEKAREAFYLCNNGNGILHPRALEFFDVNALEFLREDHALIPAVRSCAVWFEQECADTEESDLLEEWLKLFIKCGGDESNTRFALDEKERKKFERFRHAISNKVNDYISKKNLRKLGTDTAVPNDRFREFYYFSTELVAAQKINYAAYGHFGNSHLHLNLLPNDQDELTLGRELYRSICEKAIQLGGTISAEHGIGKMKRDYLLMMYGEKAVRQMAKLKKTFDPALVLNIGNVFNYDLLKSV